MTRLRYACSVLRATRVVEPNREMRPASATWAGHCKAGPHLAGDERLAEKRMFGGLAFLLDGNMCCGVHGEELIVRIPPGETEQTLREPQVRAFDMTGRPMKGWVVVAADGVAADEQLGA